MVNMKEIQQKAADLIERYHIPSVSITCYQNGSYETVTAGYRDLENQVPADADTLYSIGSCTKSFTAAAILVLCDQGLLDLDTPVKKYIPEFGMYDSYVAENLTVRDMLCHRCGLPRHELAWYPRLADYTEEQMLDMLRYLKPNAPFRYKWQYQNVMYTLAGILIRRVSGKSWRDFVEENLIAPLEMGKISYDAPDLYTFEKRANGYNYFEDAGEIRQVPYSELHTMGPAGSISMTSTQLAKWDTMFLNKGKYGDKQIISEELCTQMFTSQMLIADPVAEPLTGYVTGYTYGLGLFVENYRGTQIVHHGGHIDGFIADQCFVPSKDFACTVLTNAENSYSAQALRYTILDQMLGLEPVDWTTRFLDFYNKLLAQMKAELTPAEKKASMSADYPCPVSLADICGTYLNKGYGDIVISAAQKETDGGQAEADLYASSESADADLIMKLGTITMYGRHYRNGYFLFTEPHLLTGLELEAEVEADREGKVTAFLVALELTSTEKIRFERQ